MRRLPGPGERAWLIDTNDWLLVHLLLWNGYTCVLHDDLRYASSEFEWHITNFPIEINTIVELDKHFVESSGTRLKLLNYLAPQYKV